MSHFNLKRTGRLSTALRSASILWQWKNSWLTFLLAQITQWWHLLWWRKQWECSLLGQKTLIYWHHEAAMPHGTASHASPCPASHNLSHLLHARISVEAMSVVMHCSASLLRETVVRPDSRSKAFKMASTNKGPSRRAMVIMFVMSWHMVLNFEKRGMCPPSDPDKQRFFLVKGNLWGQLFPQAWSLHFCCGAGNMHYMKWICYVYGIFISVTNGASI